MITIHNLGCQAILLIVLTDLCVYIQPKTRTAVRGPMITEIASQTPAQNDALTAVEIAAETADYIESTTPKLQARKSKVLPVPQLVAPGSRSHKPDIWDCAALLVDKPKTWTSFDVCGKLKGMLKVKKIGHAGTLDPMATGLLIICTGKATKSIDSFQAMHKEYSGTMKLGEATNSYDADGDITETLQWDHLTLEQLQQEAQSKFIGDLQQIPPMFSALRVKGKRLYESAREGIVVERAARSVRVSQFDLTRDAEDSQKIHFYIACSKGTYIRSLAHDLGQAVGSAAHLVALRREAIGKYNVKDAWTVDQLQAAFGTPMRAAGTRPTASAVTSDGNATKTDEVQLTSSQTA
ncbi:hypothetical protein WJX82_001918 [Trebouxia sp. C0006]